MCVYICVCLCACVCVRARVCVCVCVCVFTTRTAAVTDVLVSGRNVGALRPGRRVGFRCRADDICRGHIIFVTPIALEPLELGPNTVSKANNQ